MKKSLLIFFLLAGINECHTMRTVSQERENSHRLEVGLVSLKQGAPLPVWEHNGVLMVQLRDDMLRPLVITPEGPAVRMDERWMLTLRVYSARPLLLVPVSRAPSPALPGAQTARKPRERFTPYEDSLIKYHVSIHGEKDWDELLLILPGRSTRQVKERYKTYLQSGINPEFTPEEDARLMDLCSDSGRIHWVDLVRYFPHKTDVLLKNRHTMLVRNSGTAPGRTAPGVDWSSRAHSGDARDENVACCVDGAPANSVNSVLGGNIDDFDCGDLDGSDPRFPWHGEDGSSALNPFEFPYFTD